MQVCFFALKIRVINKISTNLCYPINVDWVSLFWIGVIVYNKVSHVDTQPTKKIKTNLISIKRTLSELKRLLGRMRNLNPSAAHFSYPTCETTRHSPRGQLLHLNDATKKRSAWIHSLFVVMWFKFKCLYISDNFFENKYPNHRK